MGTIIDEPAEHWAPPDSLDPTPVWKQYVLVALLFVVTLVVVVVVAVTALAPQFVTPPALVPGDRLVLSASVLPAPGKPPTLVATPIVDDARSFYLVQPDKGRILALRTHWVPRDGGPDCPVVDTSAEFEQAMRALEEARRAAVSLGGNPNLPLPKFPAFSARCPGGVTYAFDLTGQPSAGFSGPIAAHALDQYLVSLGDDRVIVNLSRVIAAGERTNAPVPTGIPQPQATP